MIQPINSIRDVSSRKEISSSLISFFLYIYGVPNKKRDRPDCLSHGLNKTK